MSFNSFKISLQSRKWKNKAKLTQLKEWGIWCSQWLLSAIALMPFTWTGMVSLYLSPTGLLCSPLFPSGQAFALPRILLTSVKIHSWPQIEPFTCKLDIIFSTRWPSFAIWLWWSSTGSWWEKSNRTFMDLTKNMDGADLSIWNLFIQFQALLCSLTPFAQTAFWRKIIGNSSPIWPSSMVFSAGFTFYQQELNNTHSWISHQDKPLRTCSGSI